jgi:MFS family permease
MLAILANRTYRHLFAAQVIALAGTGLMTVALALLAYELAGANAGAVLGTALAIKMIAYVSIAPLAGDLAGKLPRRAFLVSLDLVRAAVALALPFVDQVWQIYILIALLQSASAAFTPTFQATIPDILIKEEDYTRALSLSRLAYDLENLLSPTLAALLIGVFGFQWLFGGTVIGFLTSAVLVLSVTLPRPAVAAPERGTRRTGKGIRIYLATPRLRGLLALNLAVAAAGAMVIVNTVVLVRGILGLGNSDVALALASFGGGSMVAAIVLPRLLDRIGDRPVMIPAAAVMSVLLLVFAIVTRVGPVAMLWTVLLVVWALLGAAYSAAQVPTGRLLRRSAHPEDRPSVFAAQFALSHACWLITYPLAGWLGTVAGMPVTLLALGVIAALGTALAFVLWPAADPETVAHDHPELGSNHTHLAGGRASHSHAYMIDELHRHWPVPLR